MKENFHECKYEEDLEEIKTTVKSIAKCILGSYEGEGKKGILSRLRSLEIQLKIYVGLFMISLTALILNLVKGLWQ